MKGSKDIVFRTESTRNSELIRLSWCSFNLHGGQPWSILVRPNLVSPALMIFSHAGLR